MERKKLPHNNMTYHPQIGESQTQSKENLRRIIKRLVTITEDYDLLDLVCRLLADDIDSD